MKHTLRFFVAGWLAFAAAVHGQSVIRTAGKHKLPIDSLSLSPDGRQLVVLLQKECAVWDIPGRNKRLVINERLAVADASPE